MGEQEFVTILMSSDTSTGAYWLGLSDMRQEGTWQWQNSFVEAAYTNWFPENPHLNITTNCAEINMEFIIDEEGNMEIGLWHDIHCERDRDPVGWGIHAICETHLFVK